MPTRIPAYTSGQRKRILLLSAGVPAAVLLVGVGVVLDWLPSLPDPVAVHWNAAGQPDGFGSVAANLFLLVGIVGLFVAIVTAAAVAMPASVAPSRVPRLLVATSVWLAVFLTGVIVGSMGMQRGLDHAGGAASVVPVLLGGFVAGIVLAVPVWFAAPQPALLDPDADPAPPAMTLSPGERAAWSQRVRPSNKAWLIAVPILGLVIASTAAGVASDSSALWWAALPTALIVLIVVSCLFWRVRVDARGLSVTGIAGLPKFSIPLDDIAAVRSTDVSPLAEFGGFGVRWGSGRVGVIVRAGEALEVQRSSGRSFVVTVDDAATGAALLGGLVDRRGRSAGF
jgi:hypothetical protein